MKKLICLLACLAMLLCTVPFAATAEGGELKGEIVYWSYTDNAQHLVTEFNKKYPDVKVNLQVFGGDEYKTKLITTIQDGKDMPDIFDLEENYAYEFLDSDVIADLSKMGYEDVMADFYAYMVAGARDSYGAIKAVNFQTSPVGFWYLRDACEKWLGTSDPDELAAMMNGWDAIKELSRKVKEASEGKVYLMPNTIEFVKVVGFSFTPFVRDGVFSVGQEWLDLIDTMRSFREEGLVADLNSWSGDWASKWNAGECLIRVMPSWDFFTDWGKNEGNVGIIKPFENAFEGATLICMNSATDKKDLCDAFLRFVCSEEFQVANMVNYTQVPANAVVARKLAEGYSEPKFGGQNLMKTYDEINTGVAAIVPDKYTRTLQNKFQGYAESGVLAGETNEEIIAKFTAEVKDMYPELIFR